MTDRKPDPEKPPPTATKQRGREAEALSGPPREEEVLSALEAAGYPFELRVFERLKAREMSPAFGLRMRVDETEQTREIDIRAHRVTTGPASMVSLIALIQVKRVPHGAFVGFLREPRPLPEVRFLRARCGGAPSYWLSPVQDNSHSAVMAGEHGLGPAFDRFGRSPPCAQWCVVHRPKDKDRSFVADHHAPIWDDLAMLLQAKAWSGHDASVLRLRDTLLPSFVAPYYWFPALVVDAPLYTYDVGTRALASVERLTLGVSVDTSHGVFADEVDVVTLTGLETLVDDYIATSAEIQQRMTPHIEAVLAELVKRQREQWAEQQAEPLLAATSGR